MSNLPLATGITSCRLVGWLDGMSSAFGKSKILTSLTPRCEPVLTDSDCRLTGLCYDDAVTIYGVSRAGYVPQLISLRLTSGAAVFDLLRAAGAKALVVDPSYSSKAGETLSSLPIHFSLAVRQMDGQSVAPLSPLPVPSADETVMIFHTSGSTGGSPKLVRCSAAWVDSVVVKAREACAPVDTNRRDVCTWM